MADDLTLRWRSDASALRRDSDAITARREQLLAAAVPLIASENLGTEEVADLLGMSSWAVAAQVEQRRPATLSDVWYSPTDYYLSRYGTPGTHPASVVLLILFPSVADVSSFASVAHLVEPHHAVHGQLVPEPRLRDVMFLGQRATNVGDKPLGEHLVPDAVIDLAGRIRVRPLTPGTEVANQDESWMRRFRAYLEGVSEDTWMLYCHAEITV